MTIDLDYLRHRERIERLRAQWGGSDESRNAHRKLAEGYGERIRELGGAITGAEAD